VRSTLVRGQPIHPFLFAIFPVLFLWNYNFDELSYTASPADILTPLVLVLTVSLVSWVVIRFLLKDGRRTGVLVLAGIGLVVLYGPAHEGSKDTFVFRIFGESDRSFLILWSTCFLSVTAFVFRTKSDLIKTTNFWNGVAGILVVSQLGNAAANELGSNRSTISLPGSVELFGATKPSADTQPDIYCVILDRYGGSANLKRLYRFDHSSFD